MNHRYAGVAWSRCIAQVGLAAAVVAGPSLAQHGAARPVEPAFRAGMSVGRPIGMLPQAVTSFGAAELDGWVYVLGGYFGEPHDYVTRHQSRYFYRFSATDPANVEMLPNDDRIQSVALVAHDGRLIAVGGMTIADDQTRSTDHCRAFDPTERTWTDLASLPSPRSSHEAAVVGDTLYLAGGWTLDPSQSEQHWFDEVWSLDLSDSSAPWMRHPQPFRRRALDVTARGNDLVVVGGMTSEGEVSSRVDVLDTRTGEWSQGPDLPGFGFGVSVVAAGERVYAGGMDGALYGWTPGDPEWTHVGTWTFPRFFHQLVATAADRVLAVGGIGKDVRPRHVEEMGIGDEAEVDRADQRVIAWTIPYPGAAKNRSGLFLGGDHLYQFGGNRSTGQHDFAPANFLNEGWALDLRTLEYERIGDAPHRRQSMATVEAKSGRFGWAVGGFGHDGEVARTHPEVYRYEFRSGEWTAAASLPGSRSQFGLARHGRDLWIFGGLDYDPTRDEDDHFRHLTSVLRWRAGGDGFESTDVELPTPRRAFGGALLGDRYFLVGGMREDFELVDTCDVFDLESMTWKAITPPSATRLSPELVAVGDRLFLAGGMSPGLSGELEPDRSVEMYDPATDRWSRIVDQLPIDTRQLRMFAYRGQLLVYSTNDPEALAHVMLIRPPRETAPIDRG